MSLVRDRDSFIQTFWYSFLDLYHSLPCLWDVNCPDYFRKCPKRTAYNILLEKFKELDENASVEDVKRKIDVFRTGFRREERKIRDIRSREPDSDYVPTLWYYNHLSFLSDIIISGSEKPKTSGKSTRPGPSFFKFKSDDDENREPKPKKIRRDNFTIVKKCCINLVKKHGRSVTLFDDHAFRELINLIPMTAAEKQTISSEYIQKLIDEDETGDDTDVDTSMDKTVDAAADDDEDNVPLQSVKGEVEVVACTCGKDTDETMMRHAVECPASSQQTYWNFFEVSLDSATCQICHKTLTWTNITTLKKHLQTVHSDVEFIDDDDDFEKGPPSEDESTNDFGMEEVYLDDNLSDTNEPALTRSAKKRRKRAKPALNITGPITRENIALSLQRFKSLDSFGQYVASLMKLIPKDKCIKFQIQIVERLLQEQAAAG